MIEGRRRVVARNVVANLVRGVSSSLLNLILPLALIRMFSIQEYAVWVLVFSVSLFALYLDLGLVSSLSTLVARADAAGDERLAADYVAAGVRLIAAVSALIIVGYVAIATNLESLFPGIPRSLSVSAASGMVMLGCAQVVILASNVLVGYFVGLQRSQVPAKIISFGKLAVFVATIAVALAGGGVGETALAYLLATVAYLLGLTWIYLREAPRRPWTVSRRDVYRPLLSLSGVLGVFSICMLFITGLDTAIVARYAYGHLAPFGVAASVSALVIGLFGAALSPLLPEFSRMVHQGRSARIVELLIGISATLTESLLLVAAFAVFAGPMVLSLVAGHEIAGPAYPLTILLVAAAVSRTSVTPLSIGIVALKEKRGVLLAPAFAESVVNLSVSVVLCVHIGAAGVAVGTIAGAWVGLAVMLLVVVPRCPELSGHRADLLLRCWLLPILRVSLALAAAAIDYYGVGPASLRLVLTVIAVGISLWLVWRSARTRLSVSVVDPLAFLQESRRASGVRHEATGSSPLASVDFDAPA